MRRLYDAAVVESGAAAGDSPRNLLRRKRISAESASPGDLQNRVTYNNMPFAEPEKWGFLQACGNRGQAGGAAPHRPGRPQRADPGKK